MVTDESVVTSAGSWSKYGMDGPSEKYLLLELKYRIFQNICNHPHNLLNLIISSNLIFFVFFQTRANNT